MESAGSLRATSLQELLVRQAGRGTTEQRHARAARHRPADALRTHQDLGTRCPKALRAAGAPGAPGNACPAGPAPLATAEAAAVGPPVGPKPLWKRTAAASPPLPGRCSRPRFHAFSMDFRLSSWPRGPRSRRSRHRFSSSSSSRPCRATL